MKKTVIAPIVAVICMLITAFTGIEIDLDAQEKIATGIFLLGSAAVSIWGIVKDHKKKQNKTE